MEELGEENDHFSEVRGRTAYEVVGSRSQCSEERVFKTWWILPSLVDLGKDPEETR